MKSRKSFTFMFSVSFLSTNRHENLFSSPSFLQGVPGEVGAPGPSGPRVSILNFRHMVFYLSVVNTRPNLSRLSFRVTEVSLASVDPLALLDPLDLVVLLALLVTMEPRWVKTLIHSVH